MTSPNGNIFLVTGPLWGESTGHRWIPLTKVSDAELWCFFVSLNKRLNKQLRHRPCLCCCVPHICVHDCHNLNVTSSNAFSWMKMHASRRKFYWSLLLKVSIDNIPALVQIMAWRRPGDKPFPEPIMVRLLTHICGTRPPRVKGVPSIYSQNNCICNF